MNHTYTSNVNLVDKVTIKGTVGTLRRMQPNRRVSLIVASVKNGAIDVFFGSNAFLGEAPDLHFNQVGHPVSVPIPTGQYEFTIIASDLVNPTIASLILGGPSE